MVTTYVMYAGFLTKWAGEDDPKGSDKEAEKVKRGSRSYLDARVPNNQSESKKVRSTFSFMRSRICTSRS